MKDKNADIANKLKMGHRTKLAKGIIKNKGGRPKRSYQKGEPKKVKSVRITKSDDELIKFSPFGSLQKFTDFTLKLLREYSKKP